MKKKKMFCKGAGGANTPPGLYSYYKFDTGGTDSIGNVNATASNTAIVTGKQNDALEFNGSSSFVICGTGGSFKFNDITLSMWVKTSNAGSGLRAITAKRNAWYIGADGNTLFLYSYGGSVGFKYTTTDIDDNNWHLITATFGLGASNGTKFYFDGSLILTTTITEVNLTANAYIGNNLNNQYFTGAIDGVAVWDRVLTPSEVSDVYTIQNSGNDLV